MPKVDERSVALHERDSAAGVVLKVSLETLAELREVAFDLGSEADVVEESQCLNYVQRARRSHSEGLTRRRRWRCYLD